MEAEIEYEPPIEGIKKESSSEEKSSRSEDESSSSGDESSSDDEHHAFSPPSDCPPSDDDPTRWSTATLYSDQAIKYYNENHKNDEFELVDPLCFTSFYVEDDEESYLHLSFIAKSKISSKCKLFFADFDREIRCLTCIIVEPGNPLFEIGCSAGCHPSGVIYHPPLQYRGSAGCFQDGYHRLDLYEESAKQLLGDAYTIKSNVQELNTLEADELKKTFDSYVLKAIKKYNRKNRASLKHLETVYGVRFRNSLYSGKGIFWVHLIFKAENNDSNCIDNSQVLYFAQVGLDSDYITCVAIPDTVFGSSFPGDKTSCGVCSILPKGHYADCKKGTFADSLWNDWCWAVKSELQEAGDASHTATAWIEHRERMETEPTVF